MGYSSVSPNHLDYPEGSTITNELAQSDAVREIDLALDEYRKLVHMLSGARPTEILESSVTMAQMKVLMLLSVSDSGMSELATALHLSLSTISGLVERLVESGLATRRTHADDRRQVIASISPEGSAFLDRFQELGVSHLRQLLAVLAPSDIATVRRGLELLITAAQALPQEDNS